MAGNATTELTAAVQTAKGAGGYGCPERSSPIAHHAERRGNRGRTRTLPPIWSATCVAESAAVTAPERVAMCGYLVAAFQSVVLSIVSSVVTRARVRPSHSVMLLGLIPM